MQMLIDGDACPVIDIALKVARSFGIKAFIICDTEHNIQKEGAQTIMTSTGVDAADFVLVNRVQKGDVVITQDYGLAALVLSKKGYAINQNGLIYTNDNIDQLLFTRHLGKQARKGGARTKGPKKRNKENDKQFEEQLIKLIEHTI